MLSKFTYEEIMEELQNCIVLCANCHRKLHAEEKESGN
jgi:predicted HNH restriction endonuclease